MHAPAPVVSAPRASRAGWVRWTICALLFAAATVNYIDRQVIGILKPVLQREFAWTEIDYANIVFAFQLAYAVGLLLAGRVIDRIGTRAGFALAILIWSVAAIAHAAAPRIGVPGAAVLRMFGLGYSTSVAGFIFVRAALGLGEAGNFPAAIKTVAEWFPKRERALATGIFNSGTNVGALVTPLVVPWITLTYGWSWAFIATGVLGFLWLAWWLLVYRPPEEHRRLGTAELDYIRSDPQERQTRIPWIALMPFRQTWAFAIAKFLTDPIWWLYLFWVPDFLSRRHGVNLSQVAGPLVAIYIAADVGSIGGGWISSRLIASGWSVNRARKIAMLLCGLAVTPMAFAWSVQGTWTSVALIGLAAAAHQGWSCNLFTTASDMFPRQAVGSVVGFGGMTGAVGGMLIAKVTGYVLQATGSYLPVFMIAASAYLVALAVFHVLAPRLDTATLGGR
jgi:MFS transporter, ACS family, hexuronate transporter